MSWSSRLQAWSSSGEKVTLSCWLLCFHLVLIWLSKLFIEHGGLEDGWEWGRIHALEFPICLAEPRNAACVALCHPLWKQDYMPRNTRQRKDPGYFLGLQKLNWTPPLGTLQIAHFSPNMFHLVIFTNKWAKPTAFCQWWSLPSYYLVSWSLFFLVCVLMYRAYCSKNRSIECSRNFGPFKHSQVVVSRDSAVGEAVLGTPNPATTAPPHKSILNTINWLMKTK